MVSVMAPSALPGGGFLGGGVAASGAAGGGGPISSKYYYGHFSLAAAAAAPGMAAFPPQSAPSQGSALGPHYVSRGKHASYLMQQGRKSGRNSGSFMGRSAAAASCSGGKMLPPPPVHLSNQNTSCSSSSPSGGGKNISNVYGSKQRSDTGPAKQEVQKLAECIGGTTGSSSSNVGHVPTTFAVKTVHPNEQKNISRAPLRPTCQLEPYTKKVGRSVVVSGGFDPSKGHGGPPAVRFPSQDARRLTQALFVDCSVEYDLPNVPKMPRTGADGGRSGNKDDGQRLLAIHPGWRRKRTVTYQQQQPQPQRAAGLPCPPVQQQQLFHGQHQQPMQFSFLSEEGRRKRELSTVVHVTSGYRGNQTGRH